MNSPIDVRTSAALNTPTGYIVPSGLRAFKESLSGPKALAAFNDWRSEHFTKKLFLALQDMILHQPVETRHENILIQLGVTQGLTLAAQLVSDPSVLWPSVYGEGQRVDGDGVVPARADYSTSVDKVLDED